MEALQGELAQNNEDWLKMKSPVLAEIERMRSVDLQKRERRDKVAKDTAEMKQKIKKLQIDLRHKKHEKLQLQEQYKAADKSLNRYTYVQRIGEIIKNVKKQEVEIERILADTLQVQVCIGIYLFIIVCQAQKLKLSSEYVFENVELF